ncbi:MAG: lipid-A-disaccharide synthase [Succinivibrio sp.]|nr:lipid-A-disaccharide synthase [Succinivibrio sp.]
MSAERKSHLYALVAGELSGDALGAGLMRAIMRRDPEASFIGIGGPKMIQYGLKSLYRIEDLAVMGLTEVVAHILPILRIRRRLGKTLLHEKPCVMIGIDAPDFNLTLERRLRQAGIPTVHYVSPSVWAWREGRIKKISQACDMVLALLRFEKDFYDRHQLPCTYVGHFLANAIPMENDVGAARERIDIYRTSVDPIKLPQTKIMGVLPGSRASVIARMLPVYTQAARLIRQKMPDTVFVSTVPTYELASQVKDIWLDNAPDLSITVYVGNTRDVITSCDALLLTSGTIALETMLLKRPFCVAYKVSSLTAAIGRRLLKIRTFSLPNLIAGRTIVKELIQDDCTPQALAEEMFSLLNSDNLLMKRDFERVHNAMSCNSDELAADAVFEVIKKAQASRDAAAKVGVGRDGGEGRFKNDIEPEITLPAADADLGSSKTEPKFGNVRQL